MCLSCTFIARNNDIGHDDLTQRHNAWVPSKAEMDTDRVHPRIGPGRVGSWVRFKAIFACRVGSRVRLAIAVIFFIIFH